MTPFYLKIDHRFSHRATQSPLDRTLSAFRADGLFSVLLNSAAKIVYFDSDVTPSMVSPGAVRPPSRPPPVTPLHSLNSKSLHYRWISVLFSADVETM